MEDAFPRTEIVMIIKLNFCFIVQINDSDWQLKRTEKILRDYNDHAERKQENEKKPEERLVIASLLKKNLGASTNKGD